ncbi:MBL fold metallo-hydrolase RNA specificity domain-containing protein [Anaeroselena agilis]|uniref:MBL fold metallo-hydrolase n=1 Tax=Anaeroselena agilis TaxID=3063788 RepID=A0ABU3NUQ8_9FIRM|nr:MBL fold metallo-hydrolase [Selenomonadales bacterium 4137-cl]
MQLTFLGASGMVTGSSYLLEAGQSKILVDCGMFQGSKATEALNRRAFRFEPAAIDAVLLTHAHIDHSGLLPKLCKAGYKGKIYATEATADLCRIMLPDSAHIQEFEAEIAGRKGRRAGKPPLEPLYTVDDAYASLKQFEPKPYDQKLNITPEVAVRFNDAGHILGSSIIEIWVTENGKTVKFVFSGDLGQPDQPLIKDPSAIDAADYIVMESTYGNRKHEHYDKGEALAAIINETVARGGNIVIPAFAVGRTQTIIYHLYKLLKAGKIPSIPVFIDSPLAISATDIFAHHPEVFDAEAHEILYDHQESINKLLHLNFTRTAEESKAINFLKEPAIIISASGMADAGRILHHLKHNLWRPESSVILVGYQAEGSLGRRLIEGVKRVKIMGEEVSVRAKIHNLDGFSAHADQEYLIKWLSMFREPPANIFIVHGELEQANAFAGVIKDKLGYPVYVPGFGDSAVIDGRSFSVEASGMVLVDPAVIELQKLLEQLDSEFMELRKRLETAGAGDPAKLSALLRDAQKVRKYVRKTLEAAGGNGSGSK